MIGGPARDSACAIPLEILQRLARGLTYIGRPYLVTYSVNLRATFSFIQCYSCTELDVLGGIVENGRRSRLVRGDMVVSHR